MDVLIEVKDLKKFFPLKRNIFLKTIEYNRAVNGVSFSIGRNETLGLVGESGCGKTTLARCILRLIEPDSGQIILDGVDISRISYRKLFPYRRKMQIVFQDPNTSLNPRKTVYDILSEGILLHKIATTKVEVTRIIVKLLDAVGMSENALYKYPHEFSGGQRQRIAIARAISLNPELLICDEAVSSLDVSIQSQIILLLMELKKNFKLSYLFIAHDLAVVKSISDRVAVMYSGKILEIAETEELFLNPLHPYTRILISSIPEPDPSKKKSVVELPEYGFIESKNGGCDFLPRCPFRNDKCENSDNELREVRKGHFVRCVLC